MELSKTIYRTEQLANTGLLESLWKQQKERPPEMPEEAAWLRGWSVWGALPRKFFCGIADDSVKVESRRSGGVGTRVRVENAQGISTGLPAVEKEALAMFMGHASSVVRFSMIVGRLRKAAQHPAGYLGCATDCDMFPWATVITRPRARPSLDTMNLQWHKSSRLLSRMVETRACHEQTREFLQRIIDRESGNGPRAMQANYEIDEQHRVRYARWDINQRVLWHLAWGHYLLQAAQECEVQNPTDCIKFRAPTWEEDCNTLFAGGQEQSTSRFPFDPNWETFRALVLRDDTLERQPKHYLYHWDQVNRARWFFACYAAASVLLWPALVCYLAGRTDGAWANLGARFVPLPGWAQQALDNQARSD